MFDVNEYIVYGTKGVCQVKEIGEVNLSGNHGRLYYTLVPLNSKGNVIFTPVDNDKVIMRALIGKKEAQLLVKNIEDVDVIEIEDMRKKDDAYKKALATCDCHEWIRLVKTLYLSRKNRTDAGKKITAGDEKYLHIAEDHLYGELSVALGKEREELETALIKKIIE